MKNKSKMCNISNITRLRRIAVIPFLLLSIIYNTESQQRLNTYVNIYTDQNNPTDNRMTAEDYVILDAIGSARDSGNILATRTGERSLMLFQSGVLCRLADIASTELRQRLYGYQISVVLL